MLITLSLITLILLFINLRSYKHYFKSEKQLENILLKSVKPLDDEHGVDFVNSFSIILFTVLGGFTILFYLIVGSYIGGLFLSLLVLFLCLDGVRDVKQMNKFIKERKYKKKFLDWYILQPIKTLSLIYILSLLLIKLAN